MKIEITPTLNFIFLCYIALACGIWFLSMQHSFAMQRNALEAQRNDLKLHWRMIKEHNKMIKSNHELIKSNLICLPDEN